MEEEHRAVDRAGDQPQEVDGADAVRDVRLGGRARRDARRAPGDSDLPAVVATARRAADAPFDDRLDRARRLGIQARRHLGEDRVEDDGAVGVEPGRQVLVAGVADDLREHGGVDPLDAAHASLPGAGGSHSSLASTLRIPLQARFIIRIACSSAGSPRRSRSHHVPMPIVPATNA